ncbi:MAG TPA: VOC family protein [Thermomicrobiales bacterium]
MHIREVRIPARDLALLRPFYAGVLGLQLVDDGAESFTVRAGGSRLIFAQVGGADDPGVQHFAFTIPRNQLAAGKAWLAGRAALLTQGDEDQFSSALWRAQQVYFRDPAGNILELIARQTLDNAAEGPFDARQLLNVSEIGLPTDDVPGTVAALGREFGLAIYGEASDTFTAVGDANGLLIVVRAGRHWFPTTSPAQDTAIAVTIGEGGGVVERGAWAVRGDARAAG